jgi:hypothetical protein
MRRSRFSNSPASSLGVLGESDVIGDFFFQQLGAFETCDLVEDDSHQPPPHVYAQTETGGRDAFAPGFEQTQTIF